jgi:hypothetical protein
MSERRQLLEELRPHMVYVTGYEPDFDSLRAASTRIVVAAAAEGEGTFPHRAAQAVAARLGTDAVIFPSHHSGFGKQGDPDAFFTDRRLTDRRVHPRSPPRGWSVVVMRTRRGRSCSSRLRMFGQFDG